MHELLLGCQNGQLKANLKTELELTVLMYYRIRFTQEVKESYKVIIKYLEEVAIQMFNDNNYQSRQQKAQE